MIGDSVSVSANAEAPRGKHDCLSFSTLEILFRQVAPRSLFLCTFAPYMSNTALKLFYVFVRPLQRLPLGFHYFWGKVFTWLARDVLHYRRDVVLVNLSRSFPEKKYAEIKEISRDFYSHLGEVFAEAMYFGGCYRNPEKLRRSGLCRMANPELLVSSYENSPSIMIMDSHFGNWELIGGLYEYFGDFPEEKQTIPHEAACVVYKQLSSPFWEEFFKVNRTAVMEDDFQGYVESKKVLRWAVEHKGERKMYIFPTDQFPYKGTIRHEIESFMGQKTLAMEGGTALARKYSMAVLYMAYDRTEKGHYEVTFREICPDASKVTVQEILDRFYLYLEEDIRRNPANYLWSHKRWK